MENEWDWGTWGEISTESIKTYVLKIPKNKETISGMYPTWQLHMNTQNQQQAKL